MSTRVLLLGAGTVGGAIAHLLSTADDYELTVADHDEARLDQMQVDVTLDDLLANRFGRYYA